MPLSYEQMEELVRHNLSGAASVPIIDVRDRDEVKNSGLIPSATNVPLNELAGALSLADAEYTAKYAAPMPKRDAKVVVYCLKGMRADKGCTLLQKEGFTAADTYPGSWDEWSKHHKM
ncbi:Heat shock protein 67Bb [Trypanosoma grayi]|uniref:Heat shock protein 67Bb n=1 Tax=Trypanosoma grayi TaxID=71804 RepID=UPI0004F45793|nr:Heat shock protein 67Bb [Trypanosoma grayi]KEG11355.1 Heat shock protein 67Bb [Trypanosoma grayi]